MKQNPTKHIFERKSALLEEAINLKLTGCLNVAKIELIVHLVSTPGTSVNLLFDADKQLHLWQCDEKFRKQC